MTDKVHMTDKTPEQMLIDTPIDPNLDPLSTLIAQLEVWATRIETVGLPANVIAAEARAIADDAAKASGQFYADKVRQADTHKAALDELTAAHAAELDELRTAHAAELDELQARAADATTDEHEHTATGRKKR